MIAAKKILMCMFGLLYGINGHAQDIETLTFFEKFQYPNKESIVTSILPKELRQNSKQHGDLQLIMPDEIPDSVRENEEVAADILSFSAYESHSFNVKNNTEGTITDSNWSYILPLANGKDTIISTAQNTLSFAIPAITEEDKYQINVNGDIYGHVLFSGKMNGETVTDTYHLLLDLKPHIKRISDLIKKESALLDYYDISFQIEYMGTDLLSVSIEEEDNSKIRTQYIYEPYLAHIDIPSITAFKYAWIDIKLENKYGEEIYTIELPPFKDNANAITPIGQGNQEHNNPTDIEVWTQNGNKILLAHDLNELHDLRKGLYILRYYKDGTYIKTTKYLKQ